MKKEIKTRPTKNKILWLWRSYDHTVELSGNLRSPIKANGLADAYLKKRVKSNVCILCNSITFLRDKLFAWYWGVGGCKTIL